jgi:hypothetical protein
VVVFRETSNVFQAEANQKAQGLLRHQLLAARRTTLSDHHASRRQGLEDD